MRLLRLTENIIHADRETKPRLLYWQLLIQSLARRAKTLLVRISGPRVTPTIMMRESERRALAAEARRLLAEKLSGYFTTAHAFEYVKPLGKGSAAGALLFNDLKKEDPKRIRRRLVVKYAFSEYEQRNKMANDEIRNETRWLQTLSGAEHIVQLIPCEIDETQLPRPALVMEFLEGGDVGQLLTRASIAMAYPPWAEGERETIPADQAASNLVHGDLHDENILLDSLYLDPEHQHAPLLKSRQHVDVKEQVVTALVAKKYSVISDENMQVDVLDDTGNTQQILVYTDPAVRDSTHLSAELRNLLLRSQAINPAERPALDRLLALCEAAVKTHSADQYHNIPGYDHSFESDDSIREFVQQVMLDADITTSSVS
ncbi:hypothetical protein F5X99DRAFT_409181 [Biscogniauxia marginata]|nr:hypothetical protein F5X99DRAFT_409181 [Biscogniauxia marginata]